MEYSEWPSERGSNLPSVKQAAQDTMAKAQIYHEEDGDRNIKLA